MKVVKELDKEQVEVVAFSANDAWFYYFDYAWVRYCANRGYASRDEALSAGVEHLEQVL